MTSSSDPPRRAGFIDSDTGQKSFFGDDDQFSVQHTASGLVVTDEVNDNQWVHKDDGTFDTPAVDTVDLDIDGSDFVSSGDTFALPSYVDGGTATTTSNSYQSTDLVDGVKFQWDTFAPAGATIEVTFVAYLNPNGDQIDARWYNFTDGETVVEKTGVTVANSYAITSTYEPTTTSGFTGYRIDIRNSDGSTSVEIQDVNIYLGVAV